MFRKSFIIALRNVWRNKLFSVINIAGLSTGLACVFIILLYVRYEFSYDRFIVHGKNIFRVALNRIYPDSEVRYPIIPHSVGPAMLQDFPEVEACTRILRFPGEITFRSGEESYAEGNVAAADSNILDFFGIRLLEGDPHEVLRDPGQVLLSRSVARKYFGREEALGKSLSIVGFRDVLVSGIFEDLPQNTHLNFDILASLKVMDFIRQPNFVSFSTLTYIRLSDPKAAGEIEKRMPGLIRTYGAGQIESTMGLPYDDYIAAGNGYDYFLQPLFDIHLHSNMEGEFKPNGNYHYVMISISIAIFILILACINFMNLSTARATERAREVGIRKTVGAGRIQLIRQFLAESLMITLVSLMIAVLLTELVLPSFNSLTGARISIRVFDAFTLPVLSCLVLFVGFLAGFYPAFVLSSFMPTRALKGRFPAYSGGKTTRDVLVVLQFTVSVFLMTFTLLVHRQLRYLLNTGMGYDRNNILVVEGGINTAQRETFKQELGKFSWLAGSGASGTEITGGYYPGFMVQVERYGSDVITSRFMTVDEDFMGTMQIHVVKGRGFSPEFNDSLNVLINETAVRDFNLTEPVGAKLIEPVETDGDRELREWTVIGVFNDFHYTSLHENLNSFVLQSTSGPNGGFTNSLYLKLRTMDPAMAVEKIGEKWTELFPEQPFRYYFLDDNIREMYAGDLTSGSLLNVFTLLAILLACVGLFGLAAFIAEKKTKEIGIRKVNGADTGRIIWLISAGFNRLILYSILLSVPLSILVMNRWLTNFPYRAGIPVWIFPVSGMLALGIALLTVSFHAIRTANKNPAETLRYE